MKKILAVVVIAVVTACGSTELVVESDTWGPWGVGPFWIS